MRHLWKCLLLGALVALMLAPTAAQSATKKSRKACKDATLVPTVPSQMKRIDLATRCLINRERARRGLPKLKQNKALQGSSLWQAQDMLSFNYFDHARDGGPEFADRILRFGYASKASGYEIGENIAWASSSIATPKKMVKLWMDSPPHRENILTKSFRDQAVGAIWSESLPGGAYAESNGPFVVYVNQFGRLYGPMRKR